MPDMIALLNEVERALPDMTWKPVSPPSELLDRDKTIKVYEGHGSWVITVMSFSGSKGYDGTAVKDGTVLRLTRELAQQAFAAAEKWCFLAGIDPA